MPVILSVINLIVTWHMFQIVWSRENHKKDWKTISVEENPFLKKNNPPVFLIRISCYFKKNRFLFFFSKKNSKTHSELFLLHHAISPFLELHNNNLLYLLWHSNLRVKNVPHLCFRKVLLINAFTSSLCTCLLVQELYSAFFQHVDW